ncbi:MAG TPA: hypothetical protein VKI44_02395 [Acetobacteraceae bacterium]|nr:hypothetical protein [Acetobacteraceae bacterium]
MALPEPQLGLVISYSYLWHHEHNAGRDEGTKSRPCVIVLAIERPVDGTIMVRVAPVTHSPPSTAATALEIPRAVKRHLGLDDERSWIILDEVNEFAWPGFDLRPIPPSRDRFTYGFLPPRLFDQMTARLALVWTEGQGKSTPRD